MNYSKRIAEIKDKEDEELRNAEAFDESNYLHHSLLENSLKTHYRASGRYKKMAPINKLKLILKIIAITGLLLYAGYQLLGFKLAYSLDPNSMRYKTMCGKIPLEEQGELCSTLRAKL